MSDQPRDDLSWPADYAGGENKYHCRCIHCERHFYGNRRVLCNQCAATNDALTAARTETDRLLTLTSEQATEIVGKDKALERLKVDYERAAKGWSDETIAAAHLQLKINAQSVLLKKADSALERLANTAPLTSIKNLEDHWMDEMVARADYARAVLSELREGK